MGKILVAISTITAVCWAILFVLPRSSFSQEIKGKKTAVFLLGEVLVTGTRGTRNQAVTVTEITEEEIRDWGVQTAGEALDFIPGVDVHIGGKGQSQVNIRGFSQKDIKVLIDGVPAYETYFGTLDLSQIPVDAIARIRVIKGASSVLYGANTLGGVINIITKKGGKEPVTEFTSSFGDYDTQNYILNHGAAVGKFNYWLTVGYCKSRGFRLSDDFDKDSKYLGINSPYHEDGGKRDLSYYQKRNLNAKIGYEPDDGTKVYLSFDYHNNNRGVPPEYDRYWAFLKWNQWHLNLVGQKKFNKFFTIKTRVFYVDHEDILADVSWDNHQTKRKWFEQSKYDDYSTGSEVLTYFDFGRFSLLKMGFNYIKDNHKEKEYLDKRCFGVKKGWDLPGWQPEKESEANTYTLALEDDIWPVGRLSIVVGSSYDYFDPLNAAGGTVPDSTDSWNPQLGVVYRFSKDTRFHVSIGKKTRFPHLKELYSEHAGGNPHLGPEEVLSYELGLNRDFNRGTIWASYFYNNVKGLIQRVRGRQGWRYVNVGRAVLKGVEAGLQITPLSWMYLRCDYTYLSARDKGFDQDIPRRPRHKVDLEFRFSLPWNTSLDLLASYTACQFEYLKDGTKRRLDDFFLLNLGLRKRFLLPAHMKGEFFGNISNLDDLNYDDGHGPMPGRNFLVGVRIKF